MTPEEALAGAQRLLDESDTTVAGARLAAFVARQALEQLVDERCRALGADCPDASMRSKLVVLRALGDPDEADAAAAGVERAQRRVPSAPVRTRARGQRGAGFVRGSRAVDGRWKRLNHKLARRALEFVRIR